MKKFIVTLLSVLFLSAVSFGQGLGLNSITAKAGIIMPEDPWETGFQIGAKVDMGQLADNIHLVPFAEYWSSSYDFGSASLDLTNFKIGAAGHYMIPNVSGLYAGAGLSLNFLSVDVPGVTFFGTTTGGGSASETEFGFNVLGGYKFPIGGMNGVVEAEYNLMDVGTFQLGVGVEFDMN